MTQQPAYTVKIFRGSQVDGAPYGLSQYDFPDEVSQMINQKVLGSRDRCLQLRNTHSASTTFQQVKHLLQEEWGLPLSIQSHFLPFPQLGMSDAAGGPLLELADTDTLGTAWEAAAEHRRQEGIVEVELQTPANYLARIEGTMDSRGETQHSLVSAMKGWRHHANALKYLRGKQNSFRGDEEERAVLESKIQEQETLAQRWGQSVTKKISDWYRLVLGHEATPAEEADLESRFKKWIDDKIEARGRYLAKKQAEAEAQSLASAFSPSRVVCRSLREEESGQISADYGSFNLRSGVLLWGHLQTVFAGSRSEQFQRNAEFVPDMLPGGTIKQWVHSYRAAARKGRWMVRRAFTDDATGRSRDGLDGKPTRHLGWVVFHEDVDPLEVLTRCSSIDRRTGKVHGNDQIDKGVLYVNRYDWSYHFNGRAIDKNLPSEYKDFVQPATGSNEVQEGGYMMALDADEFSPDLVDRFSRDYEPSQMQEMFSPIRSTLSNKTQEKIFMKPTLQQTMEGFGTYVSMKDTEYEFGWLVFADKKHDDFPEADELVAIVYDGIYDLLEGHSFVVEPGPDRETSTNAKEHEDLQIAIEKNNVDLVKSLLERDSGTNVSRFEDALHLAVWIGNAEIVKMLLEKCPTTETEVYDKALHLAASGDHEDILDILLDNGADVNASSEPYMTALQAAAWVGNKKIVKRLCERNADVDIEGGRFGHALIAAVSGRNKDVTELLLENGANVNAAGGQYGHALQTAALLGDNQILESLLANGADINAIEGHYGTALQAAAYRGNKETVEILLHRGARIDGEANGEYESALFGAVIGEHKEIVDILLDHGADLNAEHKKRQGALHAAMEQWSTEIVETVLAWGADINAKCGPFTNGLQAAIKMDRPLFVEMFIDRGARVEGDIWTGNGAIVQILLDKGILRRQRVD